MSTKETYSRLKNTYTKENFFVSYALNGQITDPKSGGRAGLPVDHPIKGPVSEPSPLNNRWEYNLGNPSIDGIL